MRTVVVAAFILFIIVYAQRDWFRALCCLVVFTALANYPALPNPFDARGFNPWSVMLAAIVIGWMVSRIAHPRPWNIPPGWFAVLGLYLLLEAIAIIRLCLNLEEFRAKASLVDPRYAGYAVRSVIIDQFYAPIRYLFMAFLLLDGARMRRQLLIGIGAVLAAVFVYSLEVHRQIPFSGLAGGGMEVRHRISKWVGRHPNELAQDLAAAFWILIAFIQLKFGPRVWRFVALAAAVSVFLALGHTLSRAGFVAFVAVGLVMGCITRSGRILACVTTAAIGVVLFAPAVTERVLEGVDRSGMGDHRVSAITAGRDVIWEGAILAIGEAPLIGYGRYGYVISDAITHGARFGEIPNHPHNGFLEAALDHGVIGAVVIVLPVFYLLVTGTSLYRRRRDPLLKWAGLVGVCTAIAALVSGFFGQHFVLYENYWVFWCACGLVIRASTMRDTPARRNAPVPAVSRAARERFDRGLPSKRQDAVSRRVPK